MRGHAQRSACRCTGCRRPARPTPAGRFERKLAAWRAVFVEARARLMTPHAPRPCPRSRISEFDGVRYLHLGTLWVQGAMRIDKPHADRARVRAAHAGLACCGCPARRWARAMRCSSAWAPARSRASRRRRCAWRTTVVEINPAGRSPSAGIWFRLPRRRRAAAVRGRRRRLAGAGAAGQRARCCMSICTTTRPRRRCSTTRPSTPPAAQCSQKAA